MAYCSRCGAYIPDGQAICLACGYDPEAEKRAAEAERKKNSSSAAASASESYDRYESANNAEMRRRYEEQRQRNQEQNQRWAEEQQAKRRVQQQRQARQEENRQWAREEYARRKSEENRSSPEYPAGEQSKTENKALAALSYLSILCVLPYVFTPNDEYAKYHARQGMKLMVFGIMADVIGSLFGFGWIVSLLRLYLIYKGMSNALNGRKLPLPWIGNLLEKK